MGRKPKPQQIKKMEGNLRPEDRNNDKPEGALEKPNPPDWLTKLGKQKFRELATDLYNLGIVTKPDKHKLAVLADEYSQYIQCQQSIKRYGLVVTEADVHGNLKSKKNPSAELAMTLAKSISNQLSDFGLSPKDREQASKANTGKGEGDPIERLLNN